MANVFTSDYLGGISLFQYTDEIDNVNSLISQALTSYLTAEQTQFLLDLKVDKVLFDLSINDLQEQLDQLDLDLDNYLLKTGGTITGDLTIDGSLNVMGGATQIFTQEVEISNNKIVLNSNLEGTPPNTLESGIIVNRGDETDYEFIFSENLETFKVGKVGELQAVATREDNPTDQTIPYWDVNETRFKTNENVLIQNNDIVANDFISSNTTLNTLKSEKLDITQFDLCYNELDTKIDLCYNELDTKIDLCYNELDTKIDNVDTSKWDLVGNNIRNNNSGSVLVNTDLAVGAGATTTGYTFTVGGSSFLNGNVGIGLVAPSNISLSVGGSSRFTNVVNMEDRLFVGGETVLASSTLNNNNGLRVIKSGQFMYLQPCHNGSTTSLVFSPRFSTNINMMIRENGNVGMGINPSVPFDVAGLSRFANDVRVNGSLAVGTDSNPTEALDVVGNAKVSGNATIGSVPSGGSFGLKVEGDIYARGHMFLYAFQGQGNSGDVYIQARDITGDDLDLRIQMRTLLSGSIRTPVIFEANGDSVFNHNVGIGTTDPDEKLEVNGNALIQDRLAVGRSIQDNMTLLVSGGQQSEKMVMIHADGGNSTTEVRAGIGFSNHGGTSWSSQAIGSLRRGGNGFGDLLFMLRNNTTNDDVTTADEKMRITAEGNVRVNGVIQSTLGGSGFKFVGDNQQWVGFAPNNVSGVGDVGCYLVMWGDTGNNRDAEMLFGAKYYVFRTGSTDSGSGSEAMRITEDGNVSIGITSPDFRLDVNGGVRAVQGFFIGGTPSFGLFETGSFVFELRNVGASVSRFRLQLQNTGGADSTVAIGTNLHDFKVQLPNSSNNRTGRIRANNFSTYSDRRIKSCIEDIGYGLDAVMRLKPKKYFHHSSLYSEEDNCEDIVKGCCPNNDPKYLGENTIGLIAQDVYEVVPEVVIIPDDETHLWGLDYSKLTPICIKAIQEQQNQINQLKKENEELKEQMNKILSHLSI
jgi:hypothetical protein